MRRAPGWPLAATLGAHLLLAWWWLDATGVRTLPSIVPALREFLVVPVLVPPPSESPPSPPIPRPPARGPAEAQPIATVPADVPADARADARADVPADAPVADSAAPHPDPLAPPSPQGDAASEEATLAGRARRAAGGVDHALRKGKLAPLEATDTPWKRFSSAVEGARKDSALTLTSESYTSPDGTIVYRFRKNGRYYCRTGGGVGPGMFGAEGGGAVLFDKAGGGGLAGLVPCPSGAEFKRD